MCSDHCNTLDLQFVRFSCPYLEAEHMMMVCDDCIADVCNRCSGHTMCPVQFCFVESYTRTYPSLSILRHPGRIATDQYFYESDLSVMNRTCSQVVNDFLGSSSISDCAARGASLCR